MIDVLCYLVFLLAIYGPVPLGLISVVWLTVKWIDLNLLYANYSPEDLDI